MNASFISDFRAGYENTMKSSCAQLVPAVVTIVFSWVRWMVISKWEKEIPGYSRSAWNEQVTLGYRNASPTETEMGSKS